VAVDIVTGPNNRLRDDGTYLYDYDAEGNLILRTEKLSGQATRYAWDHRNRLVSVEIVQPPPARTFPTSGGFTAYTGQGVNSNGMLAVEDGGTMVHLTDKMWRKISFPSVGLPAFYQITASTVLSFDFYSPKLPEIVAIGLDNNVTRDDPVRYIQLAGAETGGLYGGISAGVSYAGGWQHYELRLADFAAAYPHADQSLLWDKLVFIHDDDVGGASDGGESFFRNLRLTEGTPASTVVESTSYVYDAEGRRVQRTHDPDGANPAQSATSEYFVYDGSQLSMTFNDSQQLSHRYLYGPQVDQVLVDEVFTTGTLGQPVSDEVLWLLADHQGTIRDIVDSDGTLRKHIDYDSFGQVENASFYGVNGGQISPVSPEAVDQLFYYTGQERDIATQLYNYNARWYDPGTGRFLSQDPSGFDAGDPNLYRYVGNSPLNGTDPTGLFTQKPTDYLPGLNGFGRGTASPTAMDLGYSSFGPTRNSLPSFQTNVAPSFHQQAILNGPWYSDSFGPLNLGAPSAMRQEATRGRIVGAPRPPSSSLRPLGDKLTSAGNAIRGAANNLATLIDERTATSNNGFFGTAFAMWGGVQAHSTRLIGNVAGGIVDVPGTVGGVVDEFRTTQQVYNQYGFRTAAARQIGLLQGTEAYYGTDVLTFDEVDPWAKTSEAFGRFGSTAGTAAGLNAGLSRFLTPDVPRPSFLNVTDDGIDLTTYAPSKYPNGSFSITKQKMETYPTGVAKPEGPFRLLDAAEYSAARRSADVMNNSIRDQYGLRGSGLDIHEIHPVKFGGSPTDLSNKTLLDQQFHRQTVTPWWYQLQRDVQRTK